MSFSTDANNVIFFGKSGEMASNWADDQEISMISS
jgi:TnpA family transposase